MRESTSHFHFRSPSGHHFIGRSNQQPLGDGRDFTFDPLLPVCEGVIAGDGHCDDNPLFEHTPVLSPRLCFGCVRQFGGPHLPRPHLCASSPAPLRRAVQAVINIARCVWALATSDVGDPLQNKVRTSSSEFASSLSEHPLKRN